MPSLLSSLRAPKFPPCGDGARLLLLTLSLGMAGAGCHTTPPSQVAAPSSTMGSEWVEPELLEKAGASHPLFGKVWSPARKQFLSRQEALAWLRSGDFVLLGEKHDNPDHHRLQAAIVQAIGGRRGLAAAFEMLEENDQSAVDASLQEHPNDPDALALAVQWSRSGWPEWAFYRPVFAAVLAQHLPIVAANLPHGLARGIAFHGPGVLSEATQHELGLDQPLPDALNQSLLDELRDTHCGQLPETMLGGMAAAQRARDGMLAERMVAADHGGGALLIAGAGHTRVDRGVPHRLAQLAPNKKVVSLAFIEVQDGQVAPEAYAERFLSPTLPFDLVWFTGRVPGDDPCRAFHTPTQSAWATEPSALTSQPQVAISSTASR